MVPVLLLTVAACQRRSLDEETVTMAFSVEMGAMASDDSGTKADIDASAVTQLLIGLFDTAGNPLRAISVERELDEDFTFSLALAEGMYYHLVLFAQKTDQYQDVSTYNSAELLECIHLDNVKTLNVEDTDAFSYSGEIVASERSQSITMARIFARLCVATKTPADNNVDMTMTVAELPTQFNAKTGVFSGTVSSMEFTGKSKTGETIATEYHSLAYAYVPVADLVTVTVNFERGGETVVSGTVDNVPLQRNYRTNILGDF